MPKNKRQSPTKHVHQKESKMSGNDKIFQSVQEMFAGQLEAEIIHMVLEECNWIVEKAVDNLFAICDPGIQKDAEIKNRLAQIAHDVLCSDASSDSMSVSSHSSMASSEETSSSRSGLAKSSTNNSRENILNSTELEGAVGFDPSMIEMPAEGENMDVLDQYCADADAWVSSMDNLGTTVRDSDYKATLTKSSQNQTVDDIVSLHTTNPATPLRQDVSSPQLDIQDYTSNVDDAKSQTKSSVNDIKGESNAMSFTDLDYAGKEISDSELGHPDCAVVDIVRCLSGESRTTCGVNGGCEVNTHNVPSNSTPDSSVCPNDTLPNSSTSNRSTPVTDVIKGQQVATEMEQQDSLAFPAVTSDTPFMADQIFISPEKMEYTNSENVEVLGESAPSLMCNDVVIEPDSPVSVFENLGKLAGQIAHMELQSHDDSPSSLDIFNSDDYDKEFRNGFKSDLQNYEGLTNTDLNTHVDIDDNKLGCGNSVKLENESGSINEGNTESVVSDNIPDLQTLDQEFVSTDSRTSSCEPVNCLRNIVINQHADISTIKETSNCEYNIDKLQLALEQDTDKLSSEQMYEQDMDKLSSEQVYDSDVNISSSSSDSFNESLTRALNDSINLTESSVKNENDIFEGVVRSQSCMSSQSEEELGEELTTALNKSVDLASPGEGSDIEARQVVSTKGITTTPKKTVLKLHDSDSDEKLSKFSDQSKKDMQEDNMPVGGRESQTKPLDSVGFPCTFASNLSVKACEFVPNVQKDMSFSFSVNTNSFNPNKPAPTFLTPKYVSPPKDSSRPRSPIDCRPRLPFSSGTQQTSLANSLPAGAAWVTPVRQYSSPATGRNNPPYSNIGCPPLNIPQPPPPHWLSATPGNKFGDSVVIQKEARPTKLTDIQEVEAKIQADHKCFVLLRGLPGSGKSTLARKLQHTKPGVVLSSDDYFVQDGVYRFEPHLLSEAHEWNRLRTIQNLHNGCTPIIVDNTNTQAWEMKPYVKQAQKFGYDICFLEPDTPWKFQAKELARRNTHGVPLSKIRMMLDRYEKGLTVEKVLGKPPTGNSQHKKIDSDLKTHPGNAKDRAVNAGSTDVIGPLGWRHAHPSLVQQYANNLGHSQKQHAKQPGVFTDTQNTFTKRDETVTADSCGEVPWLTAVPSPVPSVSNRPHQSTMETTPFTAHNPVPPCSNENYNNISKENWKMWKQLGLSDLVKQYSKATGSSQEMTSMDLNRGLPMDTQWVDTDRTVNTPRVDAKQWVETDWSVNTPRVDAKQLGETDRAFNIPRDDAKQWGDTDWSVNTPRDDAKRWGDTDQTLNTPRDDDTQETIPAASKSEDSKESRSPGSHKVRMVGIVKDMSPRSHSISIRDISPSSDSTFHTCSEMLTDQEEVSSSTQDQAIDSQDTSLNVSDLSTRSEEGSDVVTDNTGVVDQDRVILDKALELDNKPDDLLTTNNKPDDLLTTNDKPDAHLTTNDKHDARLTTNDKHDVHLTTNNKPDTHMTTNDKHDARLTTNDKHDARLTTNDKPDAHLTTNNKPDAHLTTNNKHDARLTTNDKPDAHLTTNNKPDAHLTTNNKPDSPQSSTTDGPDAQKSPEDDRDTQRFNIDDPDTHLASEDGIDLHQTSEHDLDSYQSSADATVTIAEADDRTLEDVLLKDRPGQCGTEQPNLTACDVMLTENIPLAENISQNCISVLQSQDVKPRSSTPEVKNDDVPLTVGIGQQKVIHFVDDKSGKGETTTDDTKDFTVPQIVNYSVEDIPQAVKDTVDELIRDNVGSDISYSVDYSVTANELKAILLFTDLDNEEKTMAEQYISYRLCDNKPTQTSTQNLSDDETSRFPPVVQEDLSEQILSSDGFNTAQILDWEEPKPARKQRLSKRLKMSGLRGLSEVKTDFEKTVKVPAEDELENQKVSKTVSAMEQEDINLWTRPQQQRTKRNYRTRASSPAVDDVTPGISTERSRTEALVTSVTCQALSDSVSHSSRTEVTSVVCRALSDGVSQSSQSQSSLESSPTKPAKKKSNRRKLDPYKQGPFLEPAVKDKVTGADWSFPVLSESVLKAELPKKKRVQYMLEHETHITARDLKVLNAINRGEDPVHLMAGRVRYQVLAGHNKDINGEVTDSSSEASHAMDKPVVARHCVDRGTITEENLEADVDFLQSSFPTIPIDELSEVLRQCGNNLQWAINLLLDWKYNLPLSSDDKDKFVSRMFQLQKSPTVPKFSFSARPSSVVHSPSSLLDMCVGCVESQHIAPRHDVETQIIMSSQQRLNSIEEKIRLNRTHSRTFSQSVSNDEEFKETILKELTSMTEQAYSDSTSDTSDGKGVPQNQPDTSYVESWTANQANDFARGPSVESSVSGHRSDEEAHDFQTLQSSTPVMALQLSRETIQVLQSQFGPVPHLSGVTGDVAVPLDYRTAQALHRCLMLTAQQQTTDRQRQMVEDEAYARRLQDEEILTTTSQPPPPFHPPPVTQSLPVGGAPQHRPHPTEQGVTSLKDIMVEEMERERKKEEEDSDDGDDTSDEQKLLEASGNHNVLANRLKRKKLYEGFPGIDETLLDDIYRDNSYNLDNTVLAIRGFLIHDTAPPKNVRTTEASAAYEEKLITAAKQQSLQEMMDSYLYSPEETKAYQEHEDPDYDDFRAEANVHHRLRHECFQKAQEAYRRGMRDVAAFYSRQGHGHSEKIKEANSRAADKILQSRNSLLKERSAVDLHGLHVDEAIEALEKIIPEREDDLQANPDKRKQHLVIITGRGSHSKGGIARIRPAVLRFLVANGYKYNEIYKGCFKILLKCR